jgi:hypothetical protein
MKIKRLNSRLILCIFAICVVLMMIPTLASCSKTIKISDITGNLSQYNGKSVSINGYVGNTLWNALTGRGAYQVDDGSANIWVVTSKEPPVKGVKVSIQGTVSPAFTLGDTNLGTVINETKRN